MQHTTSKKAAKGKIFDRVERPTERGDDYSSRGAGNTEGADRLHNSSLYALQSITVDEGIGPVAGHADRGRITGRFLRRKAREHDQGFRSARSNFDVKKERVMGESSRRNSSRLRPRDASERSS